MFVLWVGVLVGVRTLVPAPMPIVATQFIFEKAPFASAHASTIVETRYGLATAWFAGSREGANDVGIWLSRQQNDGRWTDPHEVANGVQPDGTRYPSWNPVLFEVGQGILTLFYKVGPTPQTWWGMMRTSLDGGRTWNDARRLPVGVLGPIKNKPVRLRDGSLIAGSSTESDETPSKWRIQFELTRDEGVTWSIVRPPVSQTARAIDAIQPSILLHSDGTLQAVGRTRSGRVFETRSRDQGHSWSPVSLLELPNPNAGIDALTLRDHRHLIVYNHTTKGRSPLNVAISRDGSTWTNVLTLESEPGEYSYPAVIQTSDGRVHVTYTWRRLRIKHVVIEPKRLPF
jgi:predicted neuraminidase